MPAIQCSNGKWKWGENGLCVFETKQKAESAGIAILIDKMENRIEDPNEKKINNG